IINAKLKVEIVQETSETVEEGLVISQSPDGGEKIPADSYVIIHISLGKEVETVKMPDVKGIPYEDAVLILTEHGFTMGTSEQVYNNVYAEGYVCYQNVAANTDVPKGTIIDVQVSKGPEPEIPDTYSYSASINAPSTAEDPDFTSGTKVHIVISDLNDYIWYDSFTESFPVSVNLWNMRSSEAGYITLTYEVTLPGETVTDPNTGEMETKEGTKEERTIKREIEFVKDE
nr:PASTA domain-containing protein [Lachnospiraceae bacterium]